MRRLVRLVVLVVLLVNVGACGAPTTASQPEESRTPALPASNETTILRATSASASSTTGELTVFAAASLTKAFTEIGRAFEAANPGARVTFNFAGSQQLAQQIDQGAPADVFASANQRQMDVAIGSGRIASDTVQPFVQNQLMVIYPRDNPAGLQTLRDLAKPGVKLVLAVGEVPVGEYSLAVLNKASALPEYTSAYSATVLANVVSFEENVRAVLSKVALGEADAGIVYTSDVSPAQADQVGRIEIPDELNTIATYPVAPLADAPNAGLARRFVEYVQSPPGQAVLDRFGFLPVEP